MLSASALLPASLLTAVLLDFQCLWSGRRTCAACRLGSRMCVACPESTKSVTTHTEHNLHLLSLNEVLPLCLHVKLGRRVGTLEALAVKEEAHMLSCVTRTVKESVEHLLVVVSASPRSRRTPTHAIKLFGTGMQSAFPCPRLSPARSRVRTRTLKKSLERAHGSTEHAAVWRGAITHLRHGMSRQDAHTDLLAVPTADTHTACLTSIRSIG